MYGVLFYALLLWILCLNSCMFIYLFTLILFLSINFYFLILFLFCIFFSFFKLFYRFLPCSFKWLWLLQHVTFYNSLHFYWVLPDTQSALLWRGNLTNHHRLPTPLRGVQQPLWARTLTTHFHHTPIWSGEWGNELGEQSEWDKLGL